MIPKVLLLGIMLFFSALALAMTDTEGSDSHNSPHAQQLKPVLSTNLAQTPRFLMVVKTMAPDSPISVCFIKNSGCFDLKGYVHKNENSANLSLNHQYGMDTHVQLESFLQKYFVTDKHMSCRTSQTGCDTDTDTCSIAMKCEKP